MALNLQEMATSAYNIIQGLLNSATQLAGLDALWARATPLINSEDVILQEYTLTNVGLECPLMIKVLTSNTDYNPGNFTVDLFGINYDAPLEVHVTIHEWNNIFGQDTQPLKGDIVYIKMLHKLYEVASSLIMYQIASMPTYFKCQLTKYNPTASRRETEEFRLSIDELTVSQEDLFGDVISEEVADVVNDVETRYNNTTYVDPVKDFDIKSIVSKQLIGENGNLISNAYYDFSTSESNITYHINAIYDSAMLRKHWIYSCWFRNQADNLEEGRVIKLIQYAKDKRYSYFRINATIHLEVGDEVYITRGNLFKISGIITTLNCEEGLGIQIKASDTAKANKKLTNWWQYNNLRIYKVTSVNILSGYSQEDRIFNIKYYNISNKFSIKVNNVEKDFIVPNMYSYHWNYMVLDFTNETMRLIVVQLGHNALNKLQTDEIYNEELSIDMKDFEIDEFRVEALDTTLLICNIRLYENEFPVEDTYIKEMYQPISHKASKLILVDSPNIPNGAAFLSPVR